jgi:UDP-N-acetylglucosamine 2-epimerase (non-hydrolysing)
MIKVITIIGTRPELVKMCRVIHEFDEHTQHVLVHSGQNYDYELNQIFFDELKIRKPDYFLGVSGETPAKAIADVIAKADDVFDAEKPDAVLFYGDTNTCLAVIAAKRRKIPVFHMEAGNRCFDQRVPEESNRKVVDHLSDINMVLSEHARRYLIAEGIKPETIIKTGSHLEEVLSYYMPQILESTILKKEGLEENKYFIVSAHREENVDSPEKLSALLDTLTLLAETYNFLIIVSMHPRTKKRLDSLGYSFDHHLIRFIKPFGFLDYIKLQLTAFCIISDSGTITEEASLLNLPAVTIRDAHERPEGMDVSTLIMSSIEPNEVLRAVKVVTEQHNKEVRAFQIVGDYLGGQVSKKVLRIVMSYIDYINRTVWSK